VLRIIKRLSFRWCLLFTDSEERLGYIKSKCVNLEVVNHYDVGNVKYIEVKCKLAYMTRYGYPRDCQGFKSLAPSGAGTFVGVAMGDL